MLVTDDPAVISRYENPPYVDRFLADSLSPTGLAWQRIHQTYDRALSNVCLRPQGLLGSDPQNCFVEFGVFGKYFLHVCQSANMQPE